jgi:MSHA pilin protein MshC
MNMQRRQTGFTLVELVTSIVIIGILAAAIGPKFIANQSFAERGYADEVAAALRYAQAVAVASGCGVQVTLNVNSYLASQPNASPPACNGAWNRAIQRVDGGTLQGTAPNGVTLSPAVQVVFDGNGRIINGTPPAITVGAFALTIEAGSGLVSVP